MGLVLPLLFVLPHLSPFGALAQHAPGAADRQAIERIVQDYLKGIDDHDPLALRRAFHSEARLEAAVGGFWAQPFEEWARFAEGPAPESAAQRVNRIVSIDVAGSAAIAKVVLDWPQVRYVDYLSLLRTDAGWRIVNKVWHQQRRWPGDFADAPTHFVPPPLDPTGATLVPTQLAEGVWVLLADRAPVDNIGLVVGRDAALVIDSHISRRMAEEAQVLIAEVTDRPVRWLVNTNHHGDHILGNAFFPATATVIGHRDQILDEAGFREEVEVVAAFAGKPELVELATYRPPEVLFDSRYSIDLGGRTVEVVHVGPVNTAGDVVVNVADVGVVFTGNLFTQTQVPLLWEGDASDLLRAVDVVSDLVPRQLVPGHLGPVDAQEMLGKSRDYGEWLGESVDAALGLGWSPTRIGEDLELPFRFLPPGPPAFLDLVRGFHSLNALRSAQKRAEETPPPPY